MPLSAAFEVWLDAREGSSVGVWLKLAKKHSGIVSMTDDEAVDVGVCFGWISGERRALDGAYTCRSMCRGVGPRRMRRSGMSWCQRTSEWRSRGARVRVTHSRRWASHSVMR
jgi:hypothetical protein